MIKYRAQERAQNEKRHTLKTKKQGGKSETLFATSKMADFTQPLTGTRSTQ